MKVTQQRNNEIKLNDINNEVIISHWAIDVMRLPGLSSRLIGKTKTRKELGHGLSERCEPI